MRQVQLDPASYLRSSILESVTYQRESDYRIVHNAIFGGKSVNRMNFQVTERRGHRTIVIADLLFARKAEIPSGAFPHRVIGIQLECVIDIAEFEAKMIIHDR